MEWNLEVYLLGVTGVVGSYPAVDQRNCGADGVGQVVADEQADLIAIVVGQECQKTCSQDSWQQLEDDVETSLRPSTR
jgi:hypothetical protein